MSSTPGSRRSTRYAVAPASYSLGASETPSRRAAKVSLNSPPGSRKTSVAKKKASVKKAAAATPKSSVGKSRSTTPSRRASKAKSRTASPTPSRSPSIRKRSKKVLESPKLSPKVERGESSSDASGSAQEVTTSFPTGILKSQTTSSPRRERRTVTIASEARTREWPLPFDVLWMAAFSSVAFAYAFAALHPELTLKCFSDKPQLLGFLEAALPKGSPWHIFIRCGLLFAIGTIPVRRWANKHFPETKVEPDVIITAVVGIIKLALVQFFMFKSGEVEHRASLLHASLGFAVQEFILSSCSTSSANNIQRLIEIAGNSVILFVAEDDISLKAMFFTLVTLTVSKVLRAFLVVASSRSAYKSFRRAVTFGHTALLVGGLPFIANYLYQNAQSSEGIEPPTFTSVLGPLVCGGVLISSIVLSHLDLLFN
ncbi:unnamed protein product (mitochondrion) [Plasmodiophora brassicae]|uniref:Uncharacterized protein n=1 Tax=Plasmodiophora brassicae TaxID=37360 RepID=A0A0G4IHA9_PLABS|nr:hypothetical protein PBRA_000300 [Plasmodiophora brassicae]SPQ96861.1 unnamed protein product [Plasmodiophora brassicae]